MYLYFFCFKKIEHFFILFDAFFFILIFPQKITEVIGHSAPQCSIYPTFSPISPQSYCLASYQAKTNSESGFGMTLAFGGCRGACFSAFRSFEYLAQKATYAHTNPHVSDKKHKKFVVKSFLKALNDKKHFIFCR